MSLRWIVVVGLLLLGLLIAVPPLVDGVRPSQAVSPAEADLPVGPSEMPFRAFVEESYRCLQLRDPDTLLFSGAAADYGVEDPGVWSDRTSEYLQETYALEEETLRSLRSRNRAALDKGNQLTYDVYAWYLDDLIQWHGFAHVDYCNNAYDLQSALQSFMTTFPLDSAAYVEAYLRRLATFGPWMDEAIEGFRRREAAGALPPQVLLRLALASIEPSVPTDEAGGRNPEDSLFYTALRDRLQTTGFAEEATEGWLAEARASLAESVIPAFERLAVYVTDQQSRAGDALSASRLADGTEFYAASLHHHTTSDWSPQTIHERARAEVDRIVGEMRSCAETMGWPPDLTIVELNERISEANTPIEGDALLAEYQRLIDRSMAALPACFARLPKAGVVVEVDPYSTFAYYAGPPPDGSGPGRMITNLVSVIAYTAYDEPVLMHHETVPGHHLQTALALELDLVNVRRDTLTSLYDWHPAFQPYVEGWALYGEGLAAEMGLYDDDPLGNLCRLRLELQRTARSVVDTGIHAYGWTWDDAASYLESATGVRPRPSAALRYFTQPGQSCGYTLGMWTIRDARRRAM
ncbi:MAG: DUF885 domain-containing protein, partial [Candidatus Bipolaricaulis sp.]|nr:DUF885 domain-containing protein [Candidatus Bipolaricaulis sp.]